MMREQEERNRGVYEVWKTGLHSQRQLGRMFGLSKTRVMEIVQREEEREKGGPEEELSEVSTLGTRNECPGCGGRTSRRRSEIVGEVKYWCEACKVMVVFEEEEEEGEEFWDCPNCGAEFAGKMEDLPGSWSCTECGLRVGN